ncbi:MAG: hypothetical protein COB09_19000 [Thalassobium sp.]|nr:MAG: hypothetical protein COB09_19000 [Thalassobium sp.]
MTKKLRDLKDKECRWPLGDPNDKDFGFCGKKISHRSYCAEHTIQSQRRVIKTPEEIDDANRSENTTGNRW